VGGVISFFLYLRIGCGGGGGYVFQSGCHLTVVAVTHGITTDTRMP